MDELRTHLHDTRQGLVQLGEACRQTLLAMEALAVALREHVGEDEPCLCGTDFTCMAVAHPNRDPWVMEPPC